MSEIALKVENERLKVYIEDYRKKLNDLDEKNTNQMEQLKKQYEKQIEELENKIKYLENKINLQTRKRQISNDEVKKIKELRDSGLSYSKIKKETGWSSVTINRVINGIYD